MSLEFRAIFISDTHLGMRGVHAEELSAFLKHVRCERLYLVGDILDLWSLKARWRWTVMHNQVVRRILKMAKRGVSVTYVPGNHDDALRQYAGLDLGGVRLAKQAVHRTADDRSLLVTHGDEFDLVVQHSRLLSMIGGWAYDSLLSINRVVNVGRAMLGLRRWSFAGAIKAKVKGACTFMSNFEKALLDEAARRGLNGVVCGHVHKPALVDQPGEPVYANCGDWIERCTALVEHSCGRLEIIDVEALLQRAQIEVKRADPEHVEIAESPEAEGALAC
jgi:UDP-2,3-diacylglucosamine pyrophosphatase LpxH